MLILAIDTSGDVSSIALAMESRLVGEMNLRHKMDLLQRLIPNVDHLLADCKKERSDLDAVAISLGPGSFTGLRIGMATAKGIAHVLAKPIVGVSTLDALAQGAGAACAGPIIPLIHSRPKEAYWALYRPTDGRLTRITEDAISPLEVILTRAREGGEPIFCGEGAERNRGTLEAEFGPASVLPEWLNHPRAFVIARLAIERLERGESDDVMTIAPSYVQRPTPVVRLEAKKLGAGG